MGLFKSSDELLEKGHDLIKQREFGKALSTFQKAVEKAEKGGDREIVVVGNALASIMMLQSQPNSQSYANAHQSLSALGDGQLKVGIKTITASTLAKECLITSEDLKIRAQGAVPDLTQKASLLQAIGVRYQTEIGNDVLFLPELFNNRSETGIQRSMLRFAESQEAMGDAVVWTDPKRAAEYYQTAVNYRQQINDAQGEQANLMKVSMYSKSVSCWFCGREITGEQIHFFPMPAEVTPMLRAAKTNSPLPSVHDSQNAVYACRGCHSAISKKADEIALGYHKVAMAKISELATAVDNLQKQINDLRGQFLVHR